MRLFQAHENVFVSTNLSDLIAEWSQVDIWEGSDNVFAETRWGAGVPVEIAFGSGNIVDAP